MKKEDVYSREEQDFLDLIELLKEIRKDEEKIRRVEADETIEGAFFNPLLQEYNKFKEAYFDSKDNKTGNFTIEDLRHAVKLLIESQPRYKEAKEYVLWEEENRKHEEEEDEELC